MAKTLATLETPEWATEVMYRRLGKALKKFAQVSNAHLEMVEGLKQPAWVMELYIGNRTALAILEAPSKVESRYFYILYTQARHNQIIDLNQSYTSPSSGYEARIFSNDSEEVCVEWWEN